VEESTQLFSISGFIGKPELSRKTRGEQFFYVNDRYIRSPYLHHAVVKAFEGLLPEGHHPVYILKFTLPAEKLDVNIHPTKTEVRFQDEQSLYAILKPAIKRALSQHHVAPSLDFERNPLEDPDFQESQRSRIPVESPASNGGSASGFQAGTAQQAWQGQQKASQADWQALYQVLSQNQEEPTTTDSLSSIPENPAIWDDKTDQSLQHSFLILQDQYIISPIQSGLLIIHQQYARQRIAYESYMATLKAQMAYSQQQLFPEVLELSKADKQLLDDLLTDIRLLGFDIEEFGKQAFLINGVPADLEGANIQETVEQLLEDYKHHQRYAQLDRKENLARSLAFHVSRRTKLSHSSEALHRLVDHLFACEIPYYTPDGKPVFIKVSMQELEKKFEKT
jgi:DNA mismatch repair protein MutL